MSRSRWTRLCNKIKRHPWGAAWGIGLLISVGWTLRLLLGTPSVVTPSEETTYLTGRTLSDGSLDFSAALAQHCNPPIAADDNVAMGLRALPESQPTLQFLNRYAINQTSNDEQAFEVFAVLALEQGIRHGGRVTYLPHQGVLTVWTRKQYPAVAELLQRHTDSIEMWKAAVRRPAIVKPVGTTLHEIHRDVFRGACYTLARGMMYAGEGQWERAVDDFAAIDTAIEHLCRVQCGWNLSRSLILRRDMSLSLVVMMKDLTTTHPEHTFDPAFITYVRQRCQWPLQEILCEAIDNHLRIKAQTTLRDVRDPNTVKLERLLRPALTDIEEARSVQLTQLRNSIDWQAAARIQNQAIDEYLNSIRANGLRNLRSQRASVSQQHATGHDRNDLFRSIREPTAEDITVSVAWMLVNGSTAHRMRLTMDRAAAAYSADREALFLAAMVEFRDHNGRWPSGSEELRDPSEAIVPDTGEHDVAAFGFAETSGGQLPHLRRRRPWARSLRLPP